MTNTINNVPRQLLERAVQIPSKASVEENHAAIVDRGRAQAEIRALLSAPSPAGVDGWDVAGDILEKLSAAQAIIDGLRGDLAVALKVPSVAAMRAYLDTEFAKDNMRLGTERDQQAQRIGELEGLLRSCLPALSDGGCAALANRIAATLSAGKDSD